MSVRFHDRSGQNTLGMLAIADRRVAELHDEIRMLEKQVTIATLQILVLSVKGNKIVILDVKADEKYQL